MWAVAVEALARRIVELQDTVQDANDDRERLRALNAELERQATVQRKAAADAISERDAEVNRATAERERLTAEIRKVNTELDRERQKNGEAEETIANLRAAVSEAEADVRRAGRDAAEWKRRYEKEHGTDADVAAADALRIGPADLWQLTNALARARGVTTAHVTAEHVKSRPGRVLAYALWEDGTSLGLLPRRVYEGMRDIDIRAKKDPSIAPPEALLTELVAITTGRHRYALDDDKTGAYTLTKQDA